MRAGEIFGVAGVAGNGQNELLSAMSGETLAPTRRGDHAGRRQRSGGSASPSAAISAFARCRRSATATPRSASSRSPTTARSPARDRMDMVRFGLIDPGKATNYAAEVIGAFTVKATGPGRARRLALGRQPAEVHHGPRDPAAPRGARRLPADLGRRRGRGGRHPSGDRRSRRARLGGAGHLAGPRRAADALRHDRGHQSRPACRSR